MCPHCSSGGRPALRRCIITARYSIHLHAQHFAYGCKVPAGATCSEFQDFVSCLHKFCDKGSRTLVSSGGGLEGLSDASSFRSQCHEVSSNFVGLCPMDCAFTNCEWGHHPQMGVVLWIVFAITLLVALYFFVTDRPREWQCTWPPMLWAGPHRNFVGALCTIPCIMILALVYSLQIPDSTFNILFWIFICPAILGCLLCKGLTPEQRAAALVRQQQNAAALQPTRGDEYNQLTSEVDRNDSEAQLMLAKSTLQQHLNWLAHHHTKRHRYHVKVMIFIPN